MATRRPTTEVEIFLAGQRQLMLRWAGTLTRNTDAAEELVQNTTLRALTQQAKYEPGTNIGAWLYLMMYRLHLNNRRPSLASVPHLDVDTLIRPPSAPPVPGNLLPSEGGADRHRPSSGAHA